MARIHDEERGGKLSHLHQAAEASEKLGNLAVNHEAFALRVLLEGAARALAHELFETVDALADIFEIGESASNPSSCDKWGAYTFCYIFYNTSCLMLAADENDLLACRGGGRDERTGGVETAGRFLKVKNIGAVFRGKKVRACGRMTACADVAEMRTCVKKGLDIGRSHVREILTKTCPQRKNSFLHYTQVTQPFVGVFIRI